MSAKKIETFLKNTAFMTEFIPHVQSFPCLWDKDFEESRSRFSRQQAWVQISDKIGPEKLTAKECQALWTKLRICYTVHLRHLSRGRTSRFKLAKPLEFLGPFVDIQLRKPVKSAKVLPVADEGDSDEDDPPPVAENGVTEEDCLIEYCPEVDGEEEQVDGLQNIADQTIVVYVLFPEAAC
ncbi:uncharacterized protein LOC119765362 [Culex quinquefasciatus]|uniref:uncharacterized protein LOC119765362 n=1 Tax=Culex quinquefasciatus TaxID=7176 RepID=UPI0018E33A94|nr:uncharacterized protein LOC119765362 [Culex quinquefasciatus]